VAKCMNVAVIDACFIHGTFEYGEQVIPMDNVSGFIGKDIEI